MISEKPKYDLCLRKVKVKIVEEIVTVCYLSLNLCSTDAAIHVHTHAHTHTHIILRYKAEIYLL